MKAISRRLYPRFSTGGARCFEPWQVGSRESLTLRGHSGAVLAVAFSPNGRQLITASEDHTAMVWNAADGQAIWTLRGHPDRVVNALFSPDGRRIITVDQNNAAIVWDATGRRALGIFTSAIDKSLSFSQDSKRIAFVSRVGP